MRAFHLLRHPRQRRTLEGPIHSILGVLALLALVLALVVAPVPPSGAQPTLSCLADPAGDATGALDITLHCTTTTSDGVSLSVTFAGSPVIADLNGVRIWVGPGGEDRSVDLTLDPGDGTLVAQVNSMFQLETVVRGCVPSCRVQPWRCPTCHPDASHAPTTRHSPRPWTRAAPTGFPMRRQPGPRPQPWRPRPSGT